MAETFKFEADPPVGTEMAATHVRLYESANGTTLWAVVDSVAIVTLPLDGDGVYTWVSSLADSAKYHQLVAAYPIGDGEWLERAGAEVLPPRSATPDAFTLYCWTVDLGLGVVAGVKMTVAPPAEKSTVRIGDKAGVAPKTALSSALGYVSLTIPAEVGNVDVTVAGETKTISTTGRGGGTLNFATLL